MENDITTSYPIQFFTWKLEIAKDDFWRSLPAASFAEAAYKAARTYIFQQKEFPSKQMYIRFLIKDTLGVIQCFECICAPDIKIKPYYQTTILNEIKLLTEQ